MFVGAESNIPFINDQKLFENRYLIQKDKYCLITIVATNM